MTLIKPSHRAPRSRRAFLLILLAAAGVLTHAGAADPAIRIVNCDQKVQSLKRGICANHLSQEDFRAIAPGVSWFYNWNFDTNDKPPSGVSVEFLPMAWGDRPADLAGLDRYLGSAPHKPRVVLAINEPNLKGQAFIPPDKTARLYGKIKAIADKYGIPVVGPHMALGSGNDSSIKAMDPIQKKEVTYTFMVPFLEAFMFDMNQTEVPAVAFHSYGEIGELRWAVDMMHKKFNKPVWVTEYAQWKTSDQAAAWNYLIQATDFLERTPYVAGYAWFKERVDKNPSISLFDKQSGKLTRMGEAYVGLPVHDADLYYRIPGRLEAGRYVAMNNAEIHASRDAGGGFQMSTNGVAGWFEYNLQVDAAGAYQVALRVADHPGKIEILEGDQVLGSLEPTQTDWQTLQTSVQLPAVPQTLRIRCDGYGQSVNWIEFSKP